MQRDLKVLQDNNAELKRVHAIMTADLEHLLSQRADIDEVSGKPNMIMSDSSLGSVDALIGKRSGLAHRCLSKYPHNIIVRRSSRGTM